MKKDVDSENPSFLRFFFSNTRYWIAPFIGVAILIPGLILEILPNQNNLSSLLIQAGATGIIWGIIFSVWYCILDYRQVLLQIQLKKKL